MTASWAIERSPASWRNASSCAVPCEPVSAPSEGVAAHRRAWARPTSFAGVKGPASGPVWAREPAPTDGAVAPLRGRFPRRLGGFTLIEATVAIAVTGIVAALVALFIRAPVQGYADAARRAELTDQADTALRRIARDVARAAPNSVRVAEAGGKTYLEFLQTSGGGRYRSQVDGTGAGDPMDFSAPDDAFDVLGPPITLAPGEQNLILVYNLGIPGADAYAGDNLTPATSAAGVALSHITINPFRFPLESPAHRFQVVSYPVTYECDPGAGVMRRYWNYPLAAAQPTPPTGGSSALLVRDVTSCLVTYDGSIANVRAGLVTLGLTLTRQGESVTLYHAVHVANVP